MELREEMLSKLLIEAERVLRNSYAPYSNVRVASAILSEGGRVYTGVNVENSSYGLTMCAERSAVSAMISGGDRSIIAIAIVTDYPEPLMPCGACRQVIVEFSQNPLIVSYSTSTNRVYTVRLSDIFPKPFKLMK
ncbi:MAG: cytidine deaminase [Sulfolobales archaeon]|nr:cytidine deaminase [Sulfolobales archaeon]MCX8199633.1 cytidine deaminase [Sulfolobales archaeon]MDW8170587.1 cytidine deaminase [Desulfurococcaceae archaeon]